MEHFLCIHRVVFFFAKGGYTLGFFLVDQKKKEMKKKNYYTGLLGFFTKVHLGTVALNFALCRPPPCLGTLVFVVVLVSLLLAIVC